MKKKIMALIIGISMAATLVGCGNGSNGGKISNDKITIEQYRGIEVEKPKVTEVTDTAIDQSIASTLEASAKEVTDRAVQNGDIAIIDYVGKKDGVEFQGGADTDYALRIGSGKFIPGFEEGVIGHNIGETFDLNLTFPEEYKNSPDLAGQPVVFTVTVKGIKQIPELNDEFVKEVSKKSATVEEFKKEVREDLKKSNEESAKSELQGKVWQALIEKCTVDKYPEDKVKMMTDNVNTQFGQLAEAYGVDTETLVKQAYGLTIDELVKNSIKQEFAVELIAEKEKIKVSDEEYKEYTAKYAKQYGYEDVTEFETQVGKENLERTILQEKVTEWLTDNCKQVDKKEESK